VLVLVLVVANAGVGLFLIGWAAAALIGGVVARRVAGAATPVRPTRPDPDVRALLRDARAYSLATILHVLYFRAAMVVTSLVGGAVQVGYFAVAFRLSEFFAAGAAQTASSATPTLARAATEYLSRVLYSVLGVAVTLGAGVGAVLALAAPVIVQVIGGDAFASAIGVVRLQAIAIGLMFVVFNLGAAVFVLREHRRLALFNAAGLICVVVLALLLVPGHGARGAAIASICGEATMLIGYGAVVARRRRADPIG
jgi:O-antigen/teichoic acid export membrane protein